jgi:hypothetical protein
MKVFFSVLIAIACFMQQSVAFPFFSCGKILQFTNFRGTYQQGRNFCVATGGRLLAVTSANFVCFRDLFQSFGITEPIYIGSYNGDPFQNAGLAFYPAGAINLAPTGTAGPLFAICEY